MDFRTKYFSMRTASRINKKVSPTQTMPLIMVEIQPQSPQDEKKLVNQSSPSSLTWVTCLRIPSIWLWIDLLWDVKLRQQSPWNSSQPCPWAKSKKSMAARFRKVACLVVSSSERSWLRAAEVAFAFFPGQHEMCDSSPRALAAVTHGRKRETAAL